MVTSETTVGELEAMLRAAGVGYVAAYPDCECSTTCRAWTVTLGEGPEVGRPLSEALDEALRMWMEDR